MSPMLLWTVLAFLLWLAFSAVVRRLRIPHAAVVSAVLSWIVARLFLWVAMAFAHQLGLSFPI
jgi:hypothetical protein